VLFGTSGTAQELGPDSSTSLGVAAVRIAVGAITLWVFIWLWPHGPSRDTVARSIGSNRLLVLVGGVGVAVYTPLFLAGATRAGVAVATVVTIGSGPFFTGGLEWSLRGRRPRLGWLVGTIVTVGGGILLISGTAAPNKDVDLLGLAFALASGLGYAVYSVTAKTTMERGMDSTVALAVPFTIGAVILSLAAVTQPFDWLGTGSGLVMTLHLGILATGVAYVLYGFGLDRLTAATTVTLVLAEPLTAILLATVVLDETIDPLGWVGAAVVLSGLVVVGRMAEATNPPTIPPTVDPGIDPAAVPGTGTGLSIDDRHAANFGSAATAADMDREDRDGR
jgi:DME family drug/metabolite transporter